MRSASPGDDPRNPRCAALPAVVSRDRRGPRAPRGPRDRGCAARLAVYRWYTMSVNSEPHRRVRRQGPVTLRGKQIPATTTDQRLLDRRGPADWVHTDPWRVLRIQAEFVE